MVYHEKFVAVIKCGGQILREQNNSVTLPFGSEYSLLLKNMESRKVNVNVAIDGQDVLFGNSLIIEPNSEMELERFLENMSQGNRFKFIQKTRKIVDHRGDKIDDGLVRIEFAFEQKVVQEQVHRNIHAYPWYYLPSVTYCNSNIGESVPVFNYSSTAVPTVGSNINFTAPAIDEGITVKGSQSNQQFCCGYIGNLEQSSVIIIKLKGMTATSYVDKPITVKTKLRCPSCGTKSKSNAQFCSECGTNLR
ncbi:MAG: hypothetical protein B7C24_10180 [Bacteroidetes bacterium 4572_77]|nr:MAG: hypothetical protein B7C24_10180 [Bacteroidetes bacterium 4572_77]